MPLTRLHTSIIEDAAEKAVAQSVDAAAARAVEKHVGEAVEKAVEKTVEQAVEKAVQKTVGKAAEKAVQKAVEKAVEKHVGAAAEKAAAQVVEKTVQLAAEKAAADAETKAELTATRPDEWLGPTRVHFLVILVDIDAIDDAEQNFTANIYTHLRWQDRRFANPDGGVREIPLESVWSPRVLLANQTEQVTKSLPEVVQVGQDGIVTYHQRYTGKLSQPQDLYQFPMDSHTFVVQFVAAGYGDDEIDFIPDIHPDNPDRPGGSIAGSLSVPDWQVVSHQALKLTYQAIAAAHAAGFGLRFEAERYITYYL